MKGGKTKADIQRKTETESKTGKRKYEADKQTERKANRRAENRQANEGQEDTILHDACGYIDHKTRQFLVIITLLNNV